MAKIRKMKLVLVGKHGGHEKSKKLKASLERTQKMLPIIDKFAPDVTVSFCSPEAARISFGLGIRHVAYSDSPHAEAVMRLSVPYVQKLLIPWIISKKEFVRFGISENNIVQYRSIDAALIVKRKSKNYSRDDFCLNNNKTILVRSEESYAAYFSNNMQSIRIIREITKACSNYNIVILGRYLSQINQLKREFGSKIIVMDKVIDGKALLELTDIFVGSGGTMTAEAALMGVPTISYDAVPNCIERYLVRIGLVRRERDPKKIALLTRKILKSDNDKSKKKAEKILNSMEDPVAKFIALIKSVR